MQAIVPHHNPTTKFHALYLTTHISFFPENFSFVFGESLPFLVSSPSHRGQDAKRLGFYIAFSHRSRIDLYTEKLSFSKLFNIFDEVRELFRVF